MAKWMDAIERMVAGTTPLPEFTRLVGIRFTEASAGRGVVEMDVDDRHTNPMGTLQGGILCLLADTVMGLAYGTTLEDGESLTMLEVKVNYLKAVRKARLRAEARVVKTGKTVGMVECDITDEQGNLVARASSTCMTLR
jgi:uncharacterized protein (TIGR00369 family)